MIQESQSPPSVNNQWFNLLGFGIAICVFIVCAKFKLNNFITVLTTLFAYTLPIVLLECYYLQTPYRESSGLQAAWCKSNIERVFYKLVGLYTTLIIILFCYWLFPEYKKPEYREYWVFLQKIAPWFMIISVPYVIFVDGKMRQPQDAYWTLGRLVCCAPPSVHQNLSQHALAWLVKGFFLPLMTIELLSKSATLSNMDYSLVMSHLGLFFVTTITILFALDVMIATIGYLFTLRLFDTHIRSTDPTCFGWLVCLACYEPFYHAILWLYIPKKLDYLACLNAIHNPFLRQLWCGCVLLALAGYVLATLAFGIRFSNLTHRGIITRGIYRLTKHPAYVSKTSFWWLALIPFAFMTQDKLLVLKMGFFIVGISSIYYWRAKTEEKHLSKDPVYVQYALWMNEHSLFAPLGRYLPFLRYKKIPEAVI